LVSQRQGALRERAQRLPYHRQLILALR